MDKFEQIFKSLNIPAWEIPETIANIVILKHFLKDKYPFLNFFQDNNNRESKEYIRNLKKSYPIFFDNENLENWLHQLWSQFAWKMSNYKDIKTLVNEISELDEKELKDFYNYFLDILEEKSYKTWYMPSPKEVNILAKNILDPKEWTFYSPVFWVWKNFIAISKDNITSFNWQEYSYQSFLLAKVYLELNNISWNIRQWLFNDDKFGWETFDYSFSIPPFWLRDETIKWDTDFHFINRVLEHLKKDWKWVIISPIWTVFKFQTKKERQTILEKKFLESIILLPKWSFSPYTSIQTVLWVFNKNKKNDKILFIDWMNSDIQEISDIYINKNEWRISKFWTIKQMEEHDFNLNPLLYIYGEEKALQIKANSSVTPIVHLIDIPQNIKERFEFWWRLINEKEKFEEFKSYTWKKKEKTKSDIKKSFMSFVISEALKYDLDKYKLIDLVEEWAKWLDFAIDNFKLEDDIRFMSFARYYIKWFIDISIWETDKDKLEKEISKEKIDNLEEDNNEKSNESFEKIRTDKDTLWYQNIETIEEENKENINEFKGDFNSKQNEEFKTIEKANEDLVRDNLENLKKLNDNIHKKIEYFSNTVKWYRFFINFFYKKNFNDWNEQIKHSMRLANIISLNSYIYNNKSQQQIDSQEKLVKYFDTQLEKEWKLETKKSYAKNLFIALIIETIILFIAVYFIFKKLSIQDINQISDLLKWAFWLTLWQITIMVWAIVKYLFPNWEKNDWK